MSINIISNTKQLPRDTVYDSNISFHPKQLEYLQKQFPNTHLPANATEGQLRHKNGQQSVIEFIAQRVR